MHVVKFCDTNLCVHNKAGRIHIKRVHKFVALVIFDLMVRVTYKRLATGNLIARQISKISTTTKFDYMVHA